MANTTDSITLNGHDWSNLYHIDYSGGTGGEKLAETIANIIHAQSNVDWRTGEEGTANYGVEDSFFNQYTQPNIFDYTKPYMLYDGLTDNHDIHQFASNLKLLRYYRKECYLLKNIESMMLNNIDIPEIDIIPVSDDEKHSVIANNREQSNLILRTHYVLRDYEQLKGMNSLYLYPLKNTQILTLRMFLRRWLNRKNLEQERVEQLLGNEMFKWFLEKYKSDDGYYSWQIEIALKNKENFYQGKEFYTDFETFIDVWNHGHPNFSNLGTEQDYTKARERRLIDAFDWCFGDDESVFNKIKNDIGIDVGTNEVKLWQIKNKKDIEDKGISIYEEDPLVIKNYLLNYYGVNGLKVGGLT